MMLLCKKKFWIYFVVISIILIACIVFGETIHLIARVKAENEVIYVEDVRVITSEKGKTDDAKQWCNENGYVFTGIDLNEGSDTKKNAYLCYKTTDVKAKAITEVRALVMDEGYSLYDYDQMVDQLSSQSSGTAQTMYNTSQEFIEKYNQGSPRAKDAYEGLNLFYVSDDGNQKLGDYILAGKADQTFYVKMLVQCSTFTVTMTLTLLNIGVAAYENDLDEENQTKLTSNWGVMLEKSNLATMIEDELLTTDEISELDQQYNDIARDLFEQIQTFTTNYENAVINYEEHGYTIDDDSVSTRKSTEDEAYDSDIDSAYNTVSSTIKDQFEEAKQEYYDYDEEAALADAEAEIEAEKSGDSDSSSEDEYDPSSDAYYIACFQTLNEYEYDDDTKLGDWIVETGHLTSEEVDYRDIYPLADAMGTVQADIVCLTGVTAATYNLQENESSEDFKTMLDELKELIRDYNGNDNDSLDIYAGAEGNYEGAQLAFTNENIRKTQASNSIGVTSEKEKFQNDIKMLWKCFSLVLTIISAIAAYIKLAAFVVNMTWAATWVSTSVVSFFTAAAAGVGTIVAGATVVLLVVVVIVVIVFLILYYTKDSNRDDDHSDYPNYVFDAVDKSDGSVATIKYQSVRGKSSDPNDDPTDINCKKQYQWVILEQTTDPYVGSHIVVTEDSKGNDITFKTVKDSNAFQDGYDNVKYFGNTNPCDLNGYCDDPDSKLYLHYTTEESTGLATPADKEEEKTDSDTGDEEDEEKNYIGDMIISIGDSATEARAGITSHSGKFYYLDYNFSPNQDFYTYIGYSITTDPDSALTDLRIAPYRGSDSNSSSITYGDISYTRIGNLGYYTDPGEKGSSTSSDALYYTKDSNAGSPILVENLQGVTDPSKLYDGGLQPVTFFGNDIAYNFNTEYKQFECEVATTSSPIDDGKYSNYVSWYGTDDDHDINNVKSTYLCYMPETKHTEGTKYLSGIFFYGGHDWEDAWYTDDVVTDFSEFTEKLQKDPHVGTENSINIANALNNSSYGSTKNIQCYLGYTWSYDSKRAITHAYIYQGDSYWRFSTSLNYSVSKTSPDTGNSIGYIASTFLYQGEDICEDYIARYPDPSNCFRNCIGMLQGETGFSMVLLSGYTETLPNDIDFSWTKHCYLPTALYIGGHQSGVDGLTLDDVVVTTNQYNGTNVDLSGETALSGNSASGSFYPVVDMKNPHEEEPFNLGYPDYYYSDDWKNYEGSLKGSNQPFYIYLKGARENKKTYISSLSIGAYSREQYEDSNGDSDDDTLKEVDKVVDNSAMIAAASSCADEMIVYNIGVDSAGQSKAWYNRSVTDSENRCYTMAEMQAPEDVRAAYIGVTRTSNSKDAITGVLLYQTDATTAGNTMTYNSVKYTCAGSSYPVYMNGKKYYLYYTKNTGVSPGKPIEDIKIDNSPIISGYATNLCGDSSHSEPYGNPDQTYYIHLKYTPDRGDFFNKLYIATGSTSRKAQCELLTNGCNEFIDLDLNGGLEGDTMLLGFRRGHIDWDSVNSKESEKAKNEEYETQTQEAIYDIIVTNGDKFRTSGFVNRGMFYYPVSTQNLNSSSGDELYLYIATPWYSAKYNKNNNANTTLPQDEYSGYLSSLAFAQSDRVPYNTSQNTEGSSSVIPWEYIMESDNVTHADFNSGEVKFTDNYAEDCRISMFGQRSDGSVKPSGEITGGFLDAQYYVGELKKK